MKSNLSIFVTAIALFGSTTSFAGESGAHGGNAVSCPGKPTVILDYYHATLPTIGNLQSPLDINQMSVNEVIVYFRKKLTQTALEKDFEDALTAIGPLESWISTAQADLKDVGDSNETYNLPKGCVKLQAAARQGAAVFADPHILDQLTEGQRGILVVHEALYFVAEKISGAQTSEQVRSLIRTILDTRATNDKLFKAIRDFGKTFAFESLVGHVYQPEPFWSMYCDESFLITDLKARTLRRHYTDHAGLHRECLEATPNDWQCEPDGQTCHSQDRPELVVLDKDSYKYVFKNGSSITYRRIQNLK